MLGLLRRINLSIPDAVADPESSGCPGVSTVNPCRRGVFVANMTFDDQLVGRPMPCGKRWECDDCGLYRMRLNKAVALAGATRCLVDGYQLQYATLTASPVDAYLPDRFAVQCARFLARMRSRVEYACRTGKLPGDFVFRYRWDGELQRNTRLHRHLLHNVPGSVWPSYAGPAKKGSSERWARRGQRLREWLDEQPADVVKFLRTVTRDGLGVVSDNMPVKSLANLQDYLAKDIGKSGVFGKDTGKYLKSVLGRSVRMTGSSRGWLPLVMQADRRAHLFRRVSADGVDPDEVPEHPTWLTEDGGSMRRRKNVLTLASTAVWSARLEGCGAKLLSMRRVMRAHRALEGRVTRACHEILLKDPQHAGDRIRGLDCVRQMSADTVRRSLETLPDTVPRTYLRMIASGVNETAGGSPQAIPFPPSSEVSVN